MAASPPIAVLDLGTGNLRSVAKALEGVGLDALVTDDPDRVSGAIGVVLPGVGNFNTAAANLRAKGLDQALAELRRQGRPYLGICLGLQLLFDESDEHGGAAGLGWLSGRVERFPEAAPSGAPLRVPHIGWNRVDFAGEHPMLAGLPGHDHYYFVHAYRAVPEEGSCIVGRTDYGGPFAAAVAEGRMFAVQFHPEKSQKAGLRLLRAYASWVASCE